MTRGEITKRVLTIQFIVRMILVSVYSRRRESCPSRSMKLSDLFLHSARCPKDACQLDAK